MQLLPDTPSPETRYVHPVTTDIHVNVIALEDEVVATTVEEMCDFWPIAIFFVFRDAIQEPKAEHEAKVAKEYV